MSPSPQFIRSIAANIAYWQQRTHNLGNEELVAVERDRQNLYRAIEFGAKLPETWRETAALALQCFAFIEQRGYWHEWIPLLEQLRDACSEEDVVVNGRLLDQLGIFYRYNRQLDKSIATHWQEQQIGSRTQDDWRMAHAHINLAATCRTMHHYDEAEQHILAARDHFRIINAPLVKFAFVAQELGLIAQARGHWVKAEEHHRHAISLWRELAMPTPLVQSLKMLGQVLINQGKTAVALPIYEEALDIVESINSRLDKSRLFIDLGRLFFNEGDWAKAEAYLLRADSAFLRHSGNLLDQAILSNNLGNVYLMNGRLDDAASHLQQAITLWQQADDAVQLANSIGTLAEVRLAQGEAAAAGPLLHQALTLLADYPDDAWGQQLSHKFEQKLDEIS